jgi:hypothetical protein
LLGDDYSFHSVVLVTLISRAPTPEEWTAFAAEQAVIAGLPVSHVLGGFRYHAATRARARAWQAALDTGNWSGLGIAKTSGFHHTSIIYALRLLKKNDPVPAPIPKPIIVKARKRNAPIFYDPRLFVPADTVPAHLRARPKIEAAE